MIRCHKCGYETRIDEIDGSKGHIDEEICYDCWNKEKEASKNG